MRRLQGAAEPRDAARTAAASARLLEFMRSGGRPLEAHNATQFEPRLTAQLGKFMKFCHGACGSLTLVSGSRCDISLPHCGRQTAGTLMEPACCLASFRLGSADVKWAPRWHCAQTGVRVGASLRVLRSCNPGTLHPLVR